MGLLTRLFGGESREVREARRRMNRDRADPRRVFVWGVLAVSYDVDPAYLPDHAAEAIRDWYGIESAADLLSRTPEDFVANEHAAYNGYRLCFLARAGYGAGVLDEASSWEMAFRHAAAVPRVYRGWQEYGWGYLEGHLGYRAHMGDEPAVLARSRASIATRIAERQRTVWAGIPFAPVG